MYKMIFILYMIKAVFYRIEKCSIETIFFDFLERKWVQFEVQNKIHAHTNTNTNTKFTFPPNAPREQIVISPRA